MKLQVFLLVVSLSSFFFANLVAFPTKAGTWSVSSATFQVKEPKNPHDPVEEWVDRLVGQVVIVDLWWGSTSCLKAPKHVYIYIVITKFVGYDQIDHCPNFQGSQLFFVGHVFCCKVRPKGPTLNEFLKKTTESPQILESIRWSGDIRWPKVDWNMAWKPSRELDPHQAVEKPSRSFTVWPKRGKDWLEAQCLKSERMKRTLTSGWW